MNKETLYNDILNADVENLKQYSDIYSDIGNILQKKDYDTFINECDIDLEEFYEIVNRNNLLDYIGQIFILTDVNKIMWLNYKLAYYDNLNSVNYGNEETRVNQNGKRRIQSVKTVINKIKNPPKKKNNNNFEIKEIKLTIGNEEISINNKMLLIDLLHAGAIDKGKIKSVLDKYVDDSSKYDKNLTDKMILKRYLEDYLFNLYAYLLDNTELKKTAILKFMAEIAILMDKQFAEPFNYPTTKKNMFTVLKSHQKNDFKSKKLKEHQEQYPNFI
jgi:hypothetical protein